MKTIFASLFLAISSTLFAQTKHEISVGAGPSFFGWGDIYGAALTATYNYQFTKHFGIEPRLISSLAWKSQDEMNDSYMVGYQLGYFGVATSMVYTPFNVGGSLFKLKSGFLLGGMVHSNNGVFSTEEFGYGHEILFGLLHTVHFRIIDKEKFFFGTELSMLTSFSEGFYNCDGFVWNFMGGIKF